MSNLQRPKARGNNLALLVLGLVLGQGGLFLGQTLLVASHQLEFLGLFGAHLTFAILATGIIDLGSLTTLARQVVAADFDSDVTAIYSPVAVARLMTAIAVCGMGLAYAVIWGGAFGLGYAIGCVPGLILWSFSAAGVLDGLRRSGLSGLAGAMPYVGSALALPFSASLSPGDAGLLLGCAFTAGATIAVVMTIISVRALGLRIGPGRTSWPAIRSVFADGFVLLANWLPGQIFYRFQIVACGLVLGPAATGLFVYAKQIANALGQLVAFLRRIEFPDLVRRVAADPTILLGSTLNALRYGFVTAALSTLAMAVISVGALVLLPPEYSESAWTIGLVAPLVTTGAIYLSFAQGLLAVGRYSVVAGVTAIATALGLAATAILLPYAHIPGLILAEVAMHVLGTGLLLANYAETAKGSRNITIVGGFPPPVTGASKNNQLLFDELTQLGANVRRLNTSGPTISLNRSGDYHLRRGLRVLSTILRLVGRGGRVLYTVPDGGLGIWYSLATLAVAKLRFKHLIIHHRTFRYIDQKTSAMGGIVALTRRNANHVFLSRGMADQFIAAYGSVPFIICTNAVYVRSDQTPSRRLGRSPVRLGHLSNLCRAKGFFEVAATFELLIEAGFDCELYIAGPVVETDVQVVIDNLREKHADRVAHLGPLHGAEKAAFYDGLDVFLFPSNYPEEAAPNVIYEALSAGVPVITKRRGCIGEMVSGNSGLVADQEVDFPCAARDALENMPFDAPARRDRAARIRETLKREIDESVAQHSVLLTLLLGEERKPQ